jgi:hypothetical protein
MMEICVADKLLVYKTIISSVELVGIGTRSGSRSPRSCLVEGTVPAIV